MEHLTAAVPPPDDIEARLHVEPMSEAEITAALAEALPDGWVCVPAWDDKAVYYWNQETEEVTWLHPVKPAAANVDEAKARLSLAKNPSQEAEEARQFVRISSMKITASGTPTADGGTQVSWPPMRRQQMHRLR